MAGNHKHWPAGHQDALVSLYAHSGRHNTWDAGVDSGSERKGNNYMMFHCYAYFIKTFIS